MKKSLSVILIVAILLTFTTGLTVFADNSDYERYVVDVVCNYPYDFDNSGLAEGVSALLTEHKCNFIKIKNDDTVYLLLEDIQFITRSKIQKTSTGYIISQGYLNIKLYEDSVNTYGIKYGLSGHLNTLKVASDPVYISYIVDNDKVYIEPEVVLALLSAKCSFEYYNNRKVLLVDLPQYTLFEALNGLDYGKYYVGNLLEQGIKDDDNIVIGVLKYFGNFKRLYRQYALDVAVNLKYQLINPFGTDRQISAEMAEAYAKVLAYDVETSENVADVETKVYKNLNNLVKLLKSGSGSNSNSFTKLYIDSYAHSGSRDQESLEIFDNTLEKLSNDEKVMKKLDKVFGKSTGVAESVLKKTVIEYIKRRAYDTNTLENYKNTFSEEARNIVGLNISEDSNDKIKYDSAMKYYETCFSDSALLESVIDDEIYKAVTKAIVMMPLDWATSGAASKAVKAYDTILTAEKIKESFNDTLKTGVPIDELKHPVKKINNASDYIMLTVMQRMITDVQRKAVEKLASDINQKKELYDVYVGSLDMYYRTSVVMMKTLKDSWQLGGLSEKEKEILNNTEQYISELSMFDYKLRNCVIPDFSESAVTDALNEEVFKNEFTDNGVITGKVLTESYKHIENAKIAVYIESNNQLIRFADDEYFTNSNGEFSIAMPEGEYLLVVTCKGCDPVNVKVKVEKRTTNSVKDIILKAVNAQSMSGNIVKVDNMYYYLGYDNESNLNLYHGGSNMKDAVKVDSVISFSDLGIYGENGFTNLYVYGSKIYYNKTKDFYCYDTADSKVSKVQTGRLLDLCDDFLVYSVNSGQEFYKYNLRTNSALLIKKFNAPFANYKGFFNDKIFLCSEPGANLTFDKISLYYFDSDNKEHIIDLQDVSKLIKGSLSSESMGLGNFVCYNNKIYFIAAKLSNGSGTFVIDSYLVSMNTDGSDIRCIHIDRAEENNNNINYSSIIDYISNDEVYIANGKINIESGKITYTGKSVQYISKENILYTENDSWYLANNDFSNQRKITDENTYKKSVSEAESIYGISYGILEHYLLMNIGCKTFQNAGWRGKTIKYVYSVFDLNKTDTKEYNALDLMDNSVSEIIKLMGGEFQVDRAHVTDFYFYNDEVFPNVRFWIDHSEYHSMEHKNGEVYVNGKTAEQGLRDGDFNKFSIAPGSLKITDTISFVNDYEDLTEGLGKVSIYYKPEMNRPPHTGGALPPMGVSLVYEYLIDDKIIVFYFDNSSLVKDRYDENSPKIFTYEEAIKVNPKCHAIEIKKDNNKYDSMLSSENITWKSGRDYPSSKFSFVCVDLNNDNVKELILHSNENIHSDGYTGVFTIEGGNTKCILTCDDISSYYPLSNIIVTPYYGPNQSVYYLKWDSSTSSYNPFLLTQYKDDKLLYRKVLDINNYDYPYITKEEFDEELRKNIKSGDSEQKLPTFTENTLENRKKYLY